MQPIVYPASMNMNLEKAILAVIAEHAIIYAIHALVQTNKIVLHVKKAIPLKILIEFVHM